MTKKRILYIHHGKGLGGAPLSLLYLIKALDTTKFEPIVLFLHNSEAIDLFKSNGINVVGVVNLYDFSHTKVWWFKWYHFPYLWRAAKDSAKTLLFAADRWLEKIRPDAIHLNTSSLIAWGKVAHKKGIPVIWHIREPLAEGYFGLRKKLIQSCVQKYSNTIVPICKNDAQPWQNCIKTHVVYNAADTNKFNFKISPNGFLKQYDLDKNDPKILFLGGLSYEKGTDVILNIFELIIQKMPQTKLLMAGYFDRNLKATPLLKRLFPAYSFKKNNLELYHKLKSNIVLLGATHQIPEAMAATNVVVFPANFGHFARPIIEAGFMKKPVIASDFPPLDELVIDGKTGFLINPKNIEEWAKKLIWLLRNKELNKKMGEAGYNFCIENFTLENQVKIIETIYNSF